MKSETVIDRAGALEQLADVLTRVGQTREARAVSAEATELLERKGIRPPVRRGLAWDGDGWWFSGDVAGTVLKMRPGQNAARRVVATGPVAGLDVDVAGDRVFVTVRDRLCRHVAATGQCLTCEAIQAAPGLLGPVAWDGEALWVVDPGAPALLRMPTPAEQAEEADEGEGP